MNTPVSFQMAELLKEKGFYKPLPSICFIKEEYNYTSTMVYEVLDMNFEYILRPTIAEVVMWLYDKHGIWIANNWQAGRQTFLYELIDVNSYENTTLIQEKNYKDVGEAEFNSPTDAYSSAIEYTLNNLI